MDYLKKNQKTLPYIIGIQWSSKAYLHAQNPLEKGKKYRNKAFKDIFWLVISWPLSYTDIRVPPRKTSLKAKMQYVRQAKKL